MNGVKERRNRSDCMAVNIRSIMSYRLSLQKNLPELIESRGFTISLGTIRAVAGGSMISEKNLDGMEPILEAIISENPRVPFCHCKGQIRPDGSVRLK